MKLIYSNGRELICYEVRPVYRITTTSVPIKHNGYKILDDDAARAILRELLEYDCYRGEKLD